MLRDQDILCFSSIDWDFIWQGHQEIMATFAAQGNRVLFVENTGVRRAKLHDLPRLKQRLQNWWKGTKGFRQVRENLFVYSPVILPFPYSRLARWINRWVLLQALRRWMHAIGFRRPLVWTFLPTPLVLDLIRHLDPQLTVYYCIDDLASSSRQARPVAGSEVKLFRQADLVFVTSRKLQERASLHSRRVHLFPFGVSFDRFAQARAKADGIPDDLASLPRPIVGYVGGVHQWVDQELLAAVAKQMPTTQFVLVGPPQTDVSRLTAQPNIHLFRARPHAAVPGYIKGFDVGIISYRLSEYTAHVYPTKLNEYLAMGIPVVATDLPEIRRFNADHGEVVRIASTPEEFARALEEAMRHRSPEVIQQRIAVAKQNSWATRIARMSELIERRLDERRREAPRWETTLRRLYHAAQRRAAGIALSVVIVSGLLFHSNFVWWVAQPLKVTEAPRPVDAIVVFAGGVGESGKAGGGYQERVKQALEFYAQGVAPRIIFASGYTWAFQEAQVMKEIAMGQGVPASAILVETNAANTHDAIRSVTATLNRERWRSIVLISSPYHMRRALLTWRRFAPTVTVIPTPVVGSQFYTHGRGASLEQIRGILHEYLALAVYKWRGWL